MKKIWLTTLLSVFFTLPGFSDLGTLYNTLDPRSIAQALAFYELYPQTEEGSRALLRATELLRANQNIIPLVPLVNRLKGSSEMLTEEELTLVERLASSFPNRKLKGYHATTEEELFPLPSDEIDLGKALILSQMEEDALAAARNYSALLDLMALQIVARLPLDATAKQKIAATNQFIFNEMHFRFPPQSIYAKDIDLFTFLPSVMDDHLGVCLGVTALYLAIAQRIDLPLEIVTPPGHIYVRCRIGNEVVNIETTARGVDMPSEGYLGVNTRRLEMRTLKEVVGMTHVNQASVYLHTEKFSKALSAYEKALPYMPNDSLLKELLGYTYLFEGREAEGRELLEEIKEHLPDEAVICRRLAKDYLEGKVDLEGVKVVFMHVDQTRESIQKKQERLQKVLQTYPHFRDGLEQLAVTWVQLNRVKEAIDLLLQYHEICPNDPTVNYYLAVLHGQRHDFKSCWNYLERAEKLTLERDFYPKALKELRLELSFHCPF
ncbi:MAG: hypothetical protein S4CHLAM45_09670 [Chlamydiales bacterium]|nr:hypothetical protein [Chlamydiales bacterium]MCH9620215.1 hypothetical protein [Chlamydiales bacterium]MCH9623070.1 hypothetical protein [Chlamydiales bacterium]